jgi:hypothetical protein
LLIVDSVFVKHWKLIDIFETIYYCWKERWECGIMFLRKLRWLQARLASLHINRAFVAKSKFFCCLLHGGFFHDSWFLRNVGWDLAALYPGTQNRKLGLRVVIKDWTRYQSTQQCKWMYGFSSWEFGAYMLKTFRCFSKRRSYHFQNCFLSNSIFLKRMFVPCVDTTIYSLTALKSSSACHTSPLLWLPNTLLPPWRWQWEFSEALEVLHIVGDMFPETEAIHDIPKNNIAEWTQLSHVLCDTGAILLLRSYCVANPRRFAWSMLSILQDGLVRPSQYF